MKKRLFAATLACILLIAFAMQYEITPFANAVISGGLTKVSGSNYRLQGIIKGSADDYLTMVDCIMKLDT